MQTTFTPEQLADPLTARSNRILRACVHCGFCTATCPTYKLLGDELDSPRGRIYLIKDMLESGRPADEKTALHLDRCLSCLSCMTTCPSGVNYMHLIDHGRAHVEATYRRPWRDRWLRDLLARVLPYPGRFRAAMAAAKLARPFAALMPDRRLRAMLRMAGAPLPGPSRVNDPGTHPAVGARRMRVAILPGCAQSVLDPGINEAAIRLLNRAGAEVVVPEGIGCCGALTHHMGREDQARETALRTIRAVLAAEAEGPLDAFLVTTSGCGTTVKDYGAIFAGTPHEAEAVRVASLARDVTEVLADLGLPPVTRPRALRVAYHPACSLQHGQRIVATPKELLAAAGYEVVTPADAHLCCGSAGTYNLLQPELSTQLRDLKLAALHQTVPQVIAAGNLGCMIQIASGTGIPVVHTVQLLDWATGGPAPKNLDEAF
ncbi:glycolate oxidase subunit GlcF [Paracoccus sp. S-4012]|uniref:glycolate oxidase subunit GlcF n=1 Tax=Paracoccus sp. S-4012 TaxID=2665648 RepID=UPI0012B09BEA|nr:glycolate oxidase subunit GlcF [Paracoccus sp. S-4012]MRX51730.1 glycolate oxidase subunit GlcF [Paracoccus sp. S-4012]